MKRLTSRKKFRAKLLAFKEWLKLNRTTPAPELMKTVVAKVHGHIAYYGVSDNSCGIGRYVHEVRKLLFKWLNRRGKRGSLTLEKFRTFLNRFPLPRPLIRVNLLASK